MPLTRARPLLPLLSALVLAGPPLAPATLADPLNVERARTRQAERRAEAESGALARHAADADALARRLAEGGRLTAAEMRPRTPFGREPDTLTDPVRSGAGAARLSTDSLFRSLDAAIDRSAVAREADTDRADRDATLRSGSDLR